MGFTCAVLGLIVLPLAAGVAAFVSWRRGPVLAVLAGFLQLLSALWFAPVVVRGGPLRYALGGWGAPLGIDLYADGLSALMLVMTAVVGCAVVVYATAYFRCGAGGEQDERRSLFWPLMLLLWAALNALFLSGDVFNLYITLELLTLAAVAMIGLDGTVEALAAALRYLLLAVIASLFYLLGVALLYGAYGTVDWQLLAERFQPDLAGRWAIALMSAGLLLKTALFPVHFWLPPAHAHAPAPASALLSALVLKGSFFVLLRLWFQVFARADLRLAGDLLAALGAAAILWGSLQAIRQRRLKSLVAYSTVAQIGYLFLVFALALQPAGGWSAWSGVAYFALAHACAKGAAFLAAGTLQSAAGSDRIEALAGIAQQQPLTVFAFALAGVSLMGLPPSGGFLAKWLLLEAAVSSGRWGLAAVILAGGVLAATYTFRVVARSLALAEQCRARPVPLAMQLAPFALAVVSLGLGMVPAVPMSLLQVGAPFLPVAGDAPP